MAQRIDLPVRAFIESKLKTNFPDLDFRRSTSLNDAVANPFAMLIQPFRHELDELKIAQSLKYYNYLTDQQVDDLLFNLLVFRKQGNKSFGTIRINFFALGDYSYDRLTFVTASGLQFFNSAAISIAPGSMLQDDDGTFYVDIAAESEATGAEYSIPNNTIIAIVENIAEIARVTNPFAFTQAASKETNFDLFKRAQDAVISRTLLNEYAIKTVLFTDFPFITDIAVVGAGSQYMTRDIVNVCGRNVHTYGKVDVYINTNTVQEDDVDVSYIPEDLTVDIVANTTAETVFPTTGEASQSGNCRGLFFEDSLYDFGSRSYYNNILRRYQDEFNEEVFTDFVIKSQTPQGELVVVSGFGPTADSARLIPYNNGYVTIDTLNSDLRSQYMFVGSSGQGNSYSQVVVNGSNFIFGKKLPEVLTTITGAIGSADLCQISVNGTSISSTLFATNPSIVVTKGDAVGKYDLYINSDNTESNTFNSLTICGFGQQKFYGTFTAASTLSSITFSAGQRLERCISIGDYVIIQDATNNFTFSTITAKDFTTNKITFDTISLYGPGAAKATIKDGIHGSLETVDQAYIFQENLYSISGYLPPGSTIRTVYGTGNDQITYVKATNAIFSGMVVGDYLKDDNSNPVKIYEITSVFSSISGVVAGSFGATQVRRYQVKNKPVLSPVISGAPFTLYASGLYSPTINEVTTFSGGFMFKQPGLAVNAITLTQANDALFLVNYSTSTISMFTSSASLLNTYGLNGLTFDGTPSFTTGDLWAVVKSNSNTLSAGGSCWNDYFSWYNTPTMDSTSLGAMSFPNTNPMLQLVIAGGPNTGIYNVVEITDNRRVKLDTTLSEVSNDIIAEINFGGSYNTNATAIAETMSLSVSVGDTLKVVSGLAEGYYRITAKNTGGLSISPGLSGNVFGNIDRYKIIRDTYQPFFFIANEDRYNAIPMTNLEVWTPMEPIRRMAEGTHANLTSSTELLDSSLSFNLQFADIPVNGTVINMLGSTRSASYFDDNNTHKMIFSPSITVSTNVVYDMEQTVQNLYQQKYEIIDNHDYYVNKLFVTPVLFLRNISEIDPITNTVIGDPLIPNVDYFLYARDDEALSLRYSAEEKNIIKFGNKWKYKGMRITYLGDPNVTLVDQFVSSPVMRTSNNDMLVKRMESTIVDVFCQVQGIAQADAITAIENYITTKSSRDPVQASDIINILYSLGAVYVNTESFLFKSYYLPPKIGGDMWLYNSGSRTEVLTPEHSAYIPGIINVEVLNG